ncbi:receptor-like protein kinase HERK 1 [Bidens hawaiensis]|uniref:receptor-like protein kinase HERK 1 n=1 Tax=Bidens hawaiensis TaxID=980011 RepID=UPI0040494E96
MSSSSKDEAVMTWDEYMDLLYIPYAEIESATNNFADENLLTQGTYCKVYKGQLLQSEELINIVVRKSRQQFLTFNELMFYKGLKHKNIDSVLKIASTENETLIIQKYEVNESLNKHLSGLTLTWMRRLHICVGVARALKSLHYDYNIIHGNIKSSKILLDHNWEPKLHGFAFAVADEHDGPKSTSKYLRALQYLDPAHENTHNYVTNKSDIFSFGVLLFEVLFGKEASIQNNDNWYFARLARSHYEEGKLDDLIDPDLRRQMNSQSLNIFAETAYCCLKVRPSERPDANQLLAKLEKTLELQHKHDQSIVAAAIEGASSSIHLAYRFQEISLATNNFSEENLIGGLGKVYKGRLMVHGKSKMMDIVVRRFDSKYGQGDALKTEISMLSSLEHKNIISFVGFCDENDEKIIIYEHL